MNVKYLLLMLALVCVFTYAAVSLVRYAWQSAAVKRTNEELLEAYAAATETPIIAKNTPEVSHVATVSPIPAVTPMPEKGQSQPYQHIGREMLTRMEELKKVNSDIVAWLKIPGVVDLPVVYRNNTYYLDHDFYGRKSAAGTLFLDVEHPFKADTQYLVVHGHNMNDGSMFGLLAHYRKNGYMKEHPLVYLDTLYRQEKFEVIGVLQVPVNVKKEGYVPFVGTRKFTDEAHFNAFVRNLKDHSLYWKNGTQILSDDALLALSTCYDDYRIVVLCKRISP